MFFVETKEKKYQKIPEGGLLQSAAWADVLRAEGKRVHTIATRTGTPLRGVVQSLRGVGRYLYVPRLSHMTSDMVAEMRNAPYAWVRCDVANEDDYHTLCADGCVVKKAPHNMQPQHNLIVDITADDATLLARMKSKTRYNIRLAQKRGVEVFTSKDQRYIDTFCALVAATGKRKHVTFHTKKHYESIIKNLPDDMCDMYIARYNGEVIAVNLVAFYGGVATYLHGATSDAHRNVMAPFLLQWRAMRDARERGFMWYDFGGVFPQSADTGKTGITRFKKGFAPREEYVTSYGSYDIVLSRPRYMVYRCGQNIKRIITRV